MRVVVDRFEGDYAVCEKEDRTMIDIDRKKLPKGCKNLGCNMLDHPAKPTSPGNGSAGLL